MGITTVLIDDERPALRVLELLLKKYPEIEIIGTYTNPIKAIEEIGELTPKVVFLDINMPQLQGLDAASKILDASPCSDIVFATAFDQYALEAFELHAIDYILKPINIERLDKTIKRILKKQSVETPNECQKLQIKCLGKFGMKWENQEPIKWRSEKTKELFLFLIHNHGRDILKEEILDRLWPEDNPDKAIRQLYNGIYYIRKALEGYGIDKQLISVNSNYNLRIGSVDLDVERLYNLDRDKIADNVKKLEEMEETYTGEYLESEDYPWAYSERERINNLYQNCLLDLSKLYTDMRQFDKAERRLTKAYEINPYEECITEQLLKLYLRTKDKSRGVKHFISYTNLIKVELDIKPNVKLIELYQSLKLS